MAAGPGTLSKYAIAKASAWGTAVTLSTNHRAPIRSSTLQFRRDTIDDDSIVGTAERALPILGNKVVGGSTVFLADYRQHLLEAALFMGTAGAPTLIETGVYKHVLPWTADVTGKFASIGLDWGGKKVHVLASVKALRRLWQSRAGRAVEETYDWLGRGMDDTQASSGWTYRYDPSADGGRLISHAHGVWRVNAASGGALGSSDKFYPTQCEVEMARGHIQDFAQAADSEEPIPGEFAVIGVRLVFFGADSGLYTLFREALENETALKMDAVYTHGVLLGSTKYRERSFYFPNLKVVEVPTELPGPGPIPFEVRMTAHKASAVPTGFPSGYDEAVTEEAQLELSTDILA
jgi:hypothetical protein